MSDKITKLSFYLEVKASDKANLKDRLSVLENDLKQIKIKDYGVYTLSNEKNHFEPIEDIIKIPHFGHNASCSGNCKESKGINNIYRVFTNSNFLISGEPESDILGEYKLNDYTRIIICGKRCKSIEAGTNKIKQVKGFYKGG